MSVSSVVVAFVAAAAVVVSGCVPDRPDRVGTSVRGAQQPAGARDCSAIFADLVEREGRRPGTSAEASLVAADASRPPRVPVGDIGDWVVRTASHVIYIEDGYPTTRCGNAGTPSIAGTEALTATAPTSEVPPFTDADLREAVDRHPAGVAVYLWSPHMPLSVDGYAELAAATEARGLGVVPLLFAESDLDFAGREATRAGMPDSALRTVASAELILRDAQLHAPSVLVFKGRSASPVMPGYRNAEGYGRWLDEVAHLF